MREQSVTERHEPGAPVNRVPVCRASPQRRCRAIELKEGTFKLVEVSHEFSGSPLKHVVVLAIEPQPAVAE